MDNERASIVELDSIRLDVNKDINEQQQEKPKYKNMTRGEMIRKVVWFCYNNIPATIIIACCGLCIILFLLELVDVSAACLWLGIFGLIGTSVGTGQIVILGNLSKQIYRFRLANQSLEESEGRLQDEVDSLQNSCSKLEKEEKKIKNTVEDLKEVADELHEKLEKFEALSDSLENVAKQTGQDIKQLLAQSSQVRNNMKQMTLENERALLGRIAQDIEFQDGQEGINKELFQEFIQRIPRHLQAYH
eukprot:TRINITY_DN10346_c0_g2_i7.p1 TRINITY_DN10346_c0_g2~~TRINITY_DN10346_c0_g2_i7.p1  ORF type:complete len:286 (+),score=31.53 TRINITY_DN10346_c0_g2_i7:119-859(+)